MAKSLNSYDFFLQDDLNCELLSRDLGLQLRLNNLNLNPA